MAERLNAKQQLQALISAGSEKRIRRGPELITAAPLRLYDPNLRNWPVDASGIPISQVNWAGLSLPIDKSNIHFLVGGVTGTGKTLTIRMLMESIISTEHTGLDRAIVYDPKQEFYPVLRGASRCPESVRLINPFDSRCFAWDLAADFTSPADALQLAKTIIPIPENSNNPFFPQAASAILAALLSVFMRKRRGQWDLLDVLKECLAWEGLVRFLSAPENISPQSMFALNTLGDSRVQDSIKAELVSHLYEYLPIAALWRRAAKSGRKLSLAAFLESRDFIILGANQANSAALKAINRLFLKRFSEKILDSPSGDWKAGNRTWIFLDETRELGNVTCISDLINKGRSRGVCAVIGFQDYPGLQRAFGDKEAHEITASIAHKLFLRMEGESATWAANSIGKAEIAETLFSFSGSTTVNISGSVGQSNSSATSHSSTQGAFCSVGDGRSSGQSQSVQHGFAIGATQSVSASVQVRESDVVMASEISHLPNFEQGGGLTGYLTEIGADGRPSVRLIKIPSNCIAGLKAPSAEQGYLPWPDEAQEITDLL